MGCLKTDNCCCCFSLRTGGLIIGWFGVISSTMGIVANQSESIDYIRFINKYHLEPRVDLIRNSMRNFENSIFFGSTLSFVCERFFNFFFKIYSCFVFQLLLCLCACSCSMEFTIKGHRFYCHKWF